MDSSVSILEGESVNLPPFTTVHQALEKLARAPSLCHRIAIIFDHHKLTFEETNWKANALARGLLDDLQESVKHVIESRDIIISVCLPHSDILVLILLAIWKSGAAYLPLDPEFPIDRLKHIILDASPCCIIVNASTKEKFLEISGDLSKIHLLEMETLMAKSSNENFSQSPNIDESEKFPRREGTPNLACVLYTSGSTGNPKGVRLTHRNLFNRLFWQWKAFPFGNTDVGCFTKSLTFVDALTEIFPPLTQGCPLVIFPKYSSQNPQTYIDLVYNNQVTRLVLVPSLLHMILLCLKITPELYDKLKHVKHWVCSGESLSPNLLKEFFNYFENSAILSNYYGSTEIMGDVTFESFSSTDDVDRKVHNCKIPIGKPIFNTTVYILDENKQIVQRGEIGEIYISGLNVCDRYLGDAKMFSERFLKNSFKSKADHNTLFRTGDYGKIRRGILFFEGRYDSQIKINGIRVNKIEIEKEIEKISGIEKSIVLIQKNENEQQKLIAFYVWSKNENVYPTESDIYETLKKSFPVYMIPEVNHISEFPLLINGKVDCQLLLSYYQELQMSKSRDVSVYTSDEITNTILATLSSVIGNPLNKDCLNKNFFEIGGNSINAVISMVKLKELQYDIKIDEFLQAKTIDDIIQNIRLKSHTSNLFPSLYLLNYKLLSIIEVDNFKEIISILADSFSQKNYLDLALQNPPETHHQILTQLWPDIEQRNISFIVQDNHSHNIGAVINLDFFNEPEIEFVGSLKPILEMHEILENPWREHLKGKGGKWLHNVFMATHASLTYQENVRLITYMESELLQFAAMKGYTGVFTVNSNRLNQEICAHYLNYETVDKYRVCDFEYEGKKPFSKIPDDVYLVAMLHYL